MRTPVPFSIDEQFVVLREVKSGGFGVVYAGWDDNLHMPIALKEILPELLSQDSALGTFQAEAQLIARLDHPGICRLYTMKKWRGRLFMIMEYIDGGDLRQLMQRLKQLDRQLSPTALFYIIMQVGHALHYAHMRVDPNTGTPLHLVHRDIAPSNIMISRMGAVKLIDFGIARVKGVLRPETIGGVIKGRPQYMSPEQVSAPDTLDHRSDIYSLAVVFLDMLTGTSVYGKTTHEYELIDRVRTRRFDLPEFFAEHRLPDELMAPIEHALQLSASNRTSTAQDFLEGLGPYAKRIGFNSEMALLEIRDFAQQMFPTSTLREEIERYHAVVQSAATMTIQMPQPGAQTVATSELAPAYGQPSTPAPITPPQAATAQTLAPPTSVTPAQRFDISEPKEKKKSKLTVGMLLTLVLGALGFVAIMYFAMQTKQPPSNVVQSTIPDAVPQNPVTSDSQLSEGSSSQQSQTQTPVSQTTATDNRSGTQTTKAQKDETGSKEGSQNTTQASATKPRTTSGDPVSQQTNSTPPQVVSRPVDNAPATTVGGSTEPLVNTTTSQPQTRKQPEPTATSDEKKYVGELKVGDGSGEGTTVGKAVVDLSGGGFKMDVTVGGDAKNPSAPVTKESVVSPPKEDWTFAVGSSTNATLFVDGSFAASLSAHVPFKSSALSPGSHAVRIEVAGATGCPLIREFEVQVPSVRVFEKDMTNGWLSVSGGIAEGMTARLTSRTPEIKLSANCSQLQIPFSRLPLLPGKYVLEVIDGSRVIFTDRDVQINPWKEGVIELNQ